MVIAEVLPVPAEVLKKRKISWGEYLLGMNTNPSSKFKLINFHLSSQATFLSHFLSQEQALFLFPWVNYTKSWASLLHFSLHSISSPLKCFLDSFFSSPCLGIYLAGSPNSLLLPFYRNYKTHAQIMKCCPIKQVKNGKCYSNNVPKVLDFPGSSDFM